MPGDESDFGRLFKFGAGFRLGYPWSSRDVKEILKLTIERIADQWIHYKTPTIALMVANAFLETFPHRG